MILITAAIAIVTQPSDAFSVSEFQETPWSISFLYNHVCEERGTDFRIYENGTLIESWRNEALEAYHFTIRWNKVICEVGISWALSITSDGQTGWFNGTYEVAPIIEYVYIYVNQTQLIYINQTEYIVVGNSTNVVFVNVTQVVLVNNTEVLVIPQVEYVLVPEIVYVNQTNRETAMAAEIPNPLLFTGAGLISGLAIGVGYRKKDEHD